MESELFLKLERAHPCQTANVMMQSRSAHSRQRCKLIYIKLFSKFSRSQVAALAVR